MQPARYRVLGAPVDAVRMDDALGFVESYVRTGTKPGYILAVNPEKVAVIQENAFLRGFFEDAALLVPDGIGMVLALRWLYHLDSRRVPGADLMQRICAAAPAKGYRLFLYGGKEDVNAGAVEALRQRHPGIRIVGRANGYVSQEQMPALIRQINESQADILFVGLGSPRQEQWIHDHLPELKVKLCQGIGGTMDTITGRVQRAPLWFRHNGLEWFYRLLRQPSRAFRQTRLVTFAFRVFLAKLSGRGTEPPVRPLPPAVATVPKRATESHG